jgi:DNA mismatch endonuclease (patch repair protein)
MSHIRGRDTQIEIKARQLLRGKHLRYHPKGIVGNPDFASKKKRLAIFVDGCFWHNCPIHFRLPKSNCSYWIDKFMKGRLWDVWHELQLRSEGWTVMRIWEHDLA